MKKKRPDPYLIDDENPEWTDEMFRTARPAREVLTELLGKEAAESLLKRKGRPPKPEAAKPISLRLEPDVYRWLKAKGPRYQSRINAILRAYMQAEPRSHS